MNESAESDVLAIVPARGGSMGVVGKNMRMLGGEPLIGHTLRAVRTSGIAAELILTSDDEEILRWAENAGYSVHERDTSLAGPESTIADVAAAIASERSWDGVVGVFQPTSPLRGPDSIRRAHEHFVHSGADSLMSVVREPHLYWFSETGDPGASRPLFGARENRQYATHGVFKETGAIQFVRAQWVIQEVSMVGGRHELFELDPGEGVDIDDVDDLAAARRRVEAGTVVFRLTANRIVGSGHLHHCLRLARELDDNDLVFLLKDCDEWVEEEIRGRGYRCVVEVDHESALSSLSSGGLAVIVNDVLDTSEDEVLLQRIMGFGVVNIEDLGSGARFANWVVNALYAPSAGIDAATGARYATLRTEFAGIEPAPVRDRPRRVLLTFGGTDPSGLAPRFASALVQPLRAAGVELVVVVGPGAAAAEFPSDVVVRSSVRSMAAEMRAADLVLTSGGRTVFECAATGTPVVVVAQNAREATHSHLGADTGALFLGLAAVVSDDVVIETVVRTLADHQLRADLSTRLRDSVDHRGAERIATGIRNVMKSGAIDA